MFTHLILFIYLKTFQELKKCFDAQDVPMLQASIAKMPEQDAIYYMNRCVASGLWVPGKNDDEPTMRENTGASGEAVSAKEVPAAVSTTDEVD